MRNLPRHRSPQGLGVMLWLGQFLAVFVFWALALSIAAFAILLAATVILEVRDWRRRYRRPPYGQPVLVEGKRRRG